jgi:hypothetical protein
MGPMRAMVFGALLLGFGLVQAQPARAGGSAASELMLDLRDLDQDGCVSWDEAWLFALADFHAVDADGSGDLTPKEFEALLVADVAEALGLLDDGDPHAGILRVSARPGMASSATFRSFDANGDGVVSLDELYPFVAAEFLVMEVKGD